MARPVRLSKDGRPYPTVIPLQLPNPAVYPCLDTESQVRV